MTQYALYFKTSDQLPLNHYVYKDNDIPPPEVAPPGTVLVIFDETSKDYDLLYAMFIEDPDKEFFDYDPFKTTYNSNTQEFSFVKKDIPSHLEQIRTERNSRIAFTDEIMLAPDLPDSVRQQILDYRQALRDITNHVTAETTVMDAPWPELPALFRPAKWEEANQ